MSASAFVGIAASRCASAFTVSAKASSSTHCQISPIACASAALSLSPVIASASARARPTRCGSSHVPPQSGISPIFENAWMKLAERAATTMSQPSAKLAPAPAATPLTAATTGTGIERMRSASGRYSRSMTSPTSTSSPAMPASLRSCPAQKPRPAPVTTTQRTAASFAAASSAARSSACIAAVKLLSAAGRFSVSVRTAPSVEVSTSGSLIEGSPASSWRAS